MNFFLESWAINTLRVSSRHLLLELCLCVGMSRLHMHMDHGLLLSSDSQMIFSLSLHMFMHEAEVRHFFNCSPLNDETIGETKRDPIVMLCREEWYLFSETESLSKFATSCSQLLSISISKFSNPVSSGQLHLSTCKTILCLKFFF